jgi:hypothetical protein
VKVDKWIKGIVITKPREPDELFSIVTGDYGTMGRHLNDEGRSWRWPSPPSGGSRP